MLRAPLALALALVWILCAGARADEAVGPPLRSALAPGDALVVEVAIGYGVGEGELSEPLAVEARARLRVVDSGFEQLICDADLEVISVRYRGPGLAFVVEMPGVEPGLSTAGGLRPAAILAPLATTDPVVNAILERQREVAMAALSLHGTETRARITPGREPWVSLEDAPRTSTQQELVARLLLRGILLAAFPPVPFDLTTQPQEYEAADARHRVEGPHTALHPLPGTEVRVRSLGPTSFARAFYAFDAVTDLGFLPLERSVASREWARVRPSLGVASWRRVGTESRILRPTGGVVTLRSSWLVRLASADVRAVPRD